MKHKKTNKLGRKFVLYMLETYKNKLAVMLMLAIAWFATKLSGDCTFLVFVLVFFGPVFFINKDCFPSKK